jgi:hypothetical protein
MVRPFERVKEKRETKILSDSHQKEEEEEEEDGIQTVIHTVKVILSLQQTLEAHRFSRHRVFQIFLDNRLRGGREVVSLTHRPVGYSLPPGRLLVFSVDTSTIMRLEK